MDNYKDTSTTVHHSNTVICEIIKWTVMALLDKSMFYNIHSLISDYTKYSSWEDYNLLVFLLVDCLPSLCKISQIEFLKTLLH